jgi:hypothetical protein
MPLLERLGIPGIVTGFAVPDSNMHAPNERMRTSDLADAVAAARETPVALREPAAARRALAELETAGWLRTAIR